MHLHCDLIRVQMSFLRKKKSSTDEVAGQHRVRIQMQLHTYPTASFELPVDIYKTPVRSIMSAASTNLKNQAQASGVLLDGELCCNIEPFSTNYSTVQG